MAFKRIFTIVIDSVGIGAAHDAKQFGDEGSDTLGHITEYWQGKLALTNLAKLGLGSINRSTPLTEITTNGALNTAYGKMQETSVGKDSMDGHWEMMGVPVLEPLGFFPNGFPTELINKISQFSGRKVIVNQPYSGTQVIHDYGEQQLKTGDLIIYTSGDSVLQIAANTKVIPLAELYKICEFTRSITLEQPYRIGRIIARPFEGQNKTEFKRTADRHDYALPPTSKTDLDLLSAAGYDVIGIGKINDIFSKYGITQSIHTNDNLDGMNQTITIAKQEFEGLCFTNLVDFDAKFGHRRDPKGYGNALLGFDQKLGILLEKLAPDDLLIITADHGNDPMFKGTDHTREYVPLIVYSKKLIGKTNLGTRKTYADLGATILANFAVENINIGVSFLDDLKLSEV